ncbi:hypothetical protein DDR33_13590 [Pararcticibacter amylolyticus]|uniref:Uncharacterized protein n=2 Tax=Pararcticibacter amylolyticus TaxID=2173175 RepID=A0A2U2PFP2_9SPHI|nr:hypothetical protein DDR33_13590 [Pararcticibacter amylolyticus]
MISSFINRRKLKPRQSINLSTLNEMSRAWYYYIEGDPFEASSYVYSPCRPGCREGYNICSIYADYHSGLPSLSDNLIFYIADGLETGLPQPQVPAGAKKYVYMKHYS